MRETLKSSAASFRFVPSAKDCRTGLTLQHRNHRCHRIRAPRCLFHRRVPSRSVVLGFADHGSAGQPLGAAAARRVQLQLRGVAAGVQRAHLSAAARAAPAGAQDAAGQPGAELQVQGQLAGSGDTPGRACASPRTIPGQTWNYCNFVWRNSLLEKEASGHDSTPVSLFKFSLSK